MVVALKKFFRKYTGDLRQEKVAASGHSLQLAIAALLIATMKSDWEANEAERRAVVRAIQARFGLAEDETGALLELAEAKVWDATDYYEFTSLINEGLSYKEKVTVLQQLWEVAFADGRIDKHEDHAIRKIAGLIFVEHRDFIDAKLRVRKAAGKGRHKS